MEQGIFRNRHVAPAPEADSRAPLEFHQRLPGYAPTPLADAPDIAAQLGIGKLWVKDESARLGLPAFKILGASWATYQALLERVGAIGAWRTVDELAAWFAPLRPLTLAAATDGNHGRAVARMARLLGFQAHIFVPSGMALARIQAIESEGAAVTVVDGTYDDAVALSAAQAGPRCMVISDTAWPGYADVPRYVIEGYSTIFWEIDDELARRGEPPPDLVIVQIGVGALAAAVVLHYRSTDAARPTIVGVEPTRAACVLASMRAGQMIDIPGPHDSIMAGLNCGAPSPVAWPIVSTGIDLFAAIEDERAEEAMRELHGAGIVAGETGAAGLGGLLELLAGEQAATVRQDLGITSATRALIFSTEGATDPQAYARIVGRKAV